MVARLAAAALVLGMGGACAEPLGQFSDHRDIGNPKHPGSARFDKTASTYRITGGGQNMWADHDDFHYVWKKMSGDVRATTDVAFFSPSPAPGAPGYVHRKGGIVLRQDLDPDSAYVDVLRMGNKQLSIQYREKKGAQTHLIWINTDRQGTVRLEKAGEYATLSVPGPDGKLRHAGGSFKLKITSPYYIGLGVCPHDDNVTETMDFSHVTIVPLKTAEKPKMESTLQTMQVSNPWEQTGVVNVVGKIEHPAWSGDGASFTYSNGGRTWRVTAEGGEPQKADDAKTAAGNSASPNGRWVYFSDKGKLWRAHPDGQERTKITFEDDSADWSPHPSPDGQWLLYGASRPGADLANGTDVEVRLVPIHDGVPDISKTLTMAKLYGGADTLNFSPWSPDSKNFAFVSLRPTN
ncbi:MAG TPA: hypothetical protein VGC16_08625 [Rhizomicrobium sp.]